MGFAVLPDDLLRLMQNWPCREAQIRQLIILLSPNLPKPSALVTYGPSATGKSSIIRAYLGSSTLRHAIVTSQECITSRHLLEKAAAAAYAAMQETYTGRCENISALGVHLQRLLERHREHFVLVFDAIDRQREAPPTLLQAFARFGELIPNLTVVLIVRHPGPCFLHASGVPHIQFLPYNRNQSLQILAQKPLDIFLKRPPAELEYDDEVHEEDKTWLWPRFCAAVWDSLGQGAARDLTSFHEVCLKLWRPFVTPIIKGDFGTRDFSRLLVHQRRLFQDESVLLDSVITKKRTIDVEGTARAKKAQELPYYAKWLLIAAYLASYNPARLDALCFMKSTERKRRKKGGGTARSGGGKTSQHRKIPRHLLAPSPFVLDRLLAVFHGIVPHDFRSTIDVYMQIATLSSLRLLVRTGAMGGSDPLEQGGKWKVGSTVTWEYVQGLARSLDFGIMDFLTE